nr:RNA-directed DNA polymerase, eukaryota [Tanacetum cinerariifolium]
NLVFLHQDIDVCSWDLAYDFDCSLHIIVITIIRRFLDPVSFAMGATSHNFFKSKEEYTQANSKSVFVTNFPDHFSARDLWNVCLTYGIIVDVFVPFKRSKAGKKFAFLRFIKVDNLERLIGNLCTIWIGRLRLHTNIMRFQKEPKSNGTASTNSNNVHSTLPKTNVSGGAFRKTFATVLSHGPSVDEPSALVLDDSCLSERDFSCSFMGKVKDINAMSNLYFALSNEGFTNVKLSYLGGHWVLMELDTIATKEKVTIEGLLVKALTRNTFAKITSTWGELIDIDDAENSPLSCIRVCVKTKPHVLIDDMIKIIIKGQIYWIRVKEWEAWIPEFGIDSEDDSSSDDEFEGDNANDDRSINEDLEHVSDTKFDQVQEPLLHTSPNFVGQHVKSEDPFGIYEILNKNKESSGDDPKYPFGYTAVGSNTDVDNFVVTKQEMLDHTSPQASLHGDGTNRVNNESRSKASFVNGNHFSGTKIQASGSILDVMDELIKELNNKHIVNFVGIQETKMGIMDLFSVKELWGNLAFDYAFSPSVGSSGGILCAWDPSVFVKDNSKVLDSFVAVYGTWIPSTTKLLVITIYAPQDLSERRLLWEYLHHLLDLWDGESILLGDFNEVRFKHERYGSVFNPNGANVFNNFIASSSLVDLPMDGYSFTWSHKSASKMSKLDRFLISDGLLAYFPSLSVTCLDKHLSDHRPILLREINVDYGPYPFCFFNSWSARIVFDSMIEDSWKSYIGSDSNSIINLKKKLQALKSCIKMWLADDNRKLLTNKRSIQNRLIELDKSFDQCKCTDDLIRERSNLFKDLQDLNHASSLDLIQKAKTGGPLRETKTQSISTASLIKSVPSWRFVLTADQMDDLERVVSYDEIKNAIWDCGTNKSPGPDGFTFKFFRKYWKIIDNDVVAAVMCFFDTGVFPPGCNSSFIALIPKMHGAKMVKDFRPISLIGSIYKIIAKVLANRLSYVISDLVSIEQSAFVANRFILDGPFILNELFSWCKHKNSKALIFKINFKKAFDSVCWDYLDMVLLHFGFGSKWRSWIHGCLKSAMGSILINGSLTMEFEFYKGLKQGDPLSPFLFILIMESLHISFSNVVNAGLFNASGLKINLLKSKIMGIGISNDVVVSAARSIGCLVMHSPFNYLGVKLKTLSIGGRLTLIKSVLSSLPLYYMSSFKAPKSALNRLEAIRRNFFNGSDCSKKKLSLISWKIDLASKNNGGLGISSFFALNRALNFKWIWRFFANGSSFWAWFIAAVHGSRGAIDNSSPYFRHSPWLDIIGEFKKLSSNGIDLISPPRSDIEEEQFTLLSLTLSTVLLPNSNDRWHWSLDSSDPQDLLSYDDWLLWFKSLRMTKRLKDVFEGKMAPKRTTKSSPDATTTTTTSVTDAQLKALIDQGVARALAARNADKNTNSDDSHVSGTGTKGVVELTQWFKKMETVFSISHCSVENQIKFSTCTFFGSALTLWNSHVMTVGPDAAYAITWVDMKKKMTDKYCPRGEMKKLESELWNLREADKIERYVGGLLDVIHGSVVASRPKTMQEEIEMANELMDKRNNTWAERQAKNKRKDDNNNQAQQQPLRKQGVAIAYIAGPGERKEYVGTLPFCNKCKFYHNGQYTLKCVNCKRVGHLTRDCRSPATTNNYRNPNCYECGNQWHYRSDCPELKNQDHENQAGGTGAHGMVHALEGGETNQDLNDVEDDINA